MLRNWFSFSFREELSPQGEAFRNGTSSHAVAVADPAAEPDPAPETAVRPALAAGPPSSGKYCAFKQIYQGAAVRQQSLPDGILKVAEMVNSTHLVGMSPDAKRCSLLMALEAAGVEIEELLQDAVMRQKALNDYEEAQRNRLRDFEAAKAEENAKIQAELDRLTSQYMSRIQTNLDAVAREQDAFHDWQKQKQQESQRIAEAAAFCVPQGAGANGNGLTMVLERATAVRR